VTHILESYPQYKLEDFYRKSFLEGGVTVGQIEVLYLHTLKRQMEKFKFEAAVHGVDLDKESSKSIPKKKSDFEFKSPEEYEKLPEEERKKLTEKMIGTHKKWVGSAPLNRKVVGNG